MVQCLDEQSAGAEPLAPAAQSKSDSQSESDSEPVITGVQLAIQNGATAETCPKAAPRRTLTIAPTATLTLFDPKASVKIAMAAARTEIIQHNETKRKKQEADPEEGKQHKKKKKKTSKGQQKRNKKVIKLGKLKLKGKKDKGSEDNKTGKGKSNKDKDNKTDKGKSNKARVNDQ